MKKVFSIIVTVFLVVAFATTGVFADSLTPLPVVSDNQYNSLVQQGVQVNSGSWYSVYFGSLSSNTDSIYAGAVPSTSITGYYTYYVASLSSGQGVRYNNSASSTTAQTLTGHDLDLDVYYALVTNSPNLPTSNCPIYPTLEDFCSAVANPTTGEVFNFTLSPGYALVINGPCEISERTYSISGSWNFDRLTNSRINGSFERVVQTNNIIDGFSPDRYLTIEQLLPWWADNSNVFGVASNYSYHNTDVVTLSDGGINYVLGYPVYYQGSGDYSVSHENAVSLTGSIYIQYSGTRPTISKVAIESLAEIVEGHYHYYNVFRPEVYDETGEVVSDGQGGTVVDFPDAPAGGGNSGQPPVNEETNLFGVLSKFVNDIKNLISQGSHAISELVNYGSSFMHSIAQMYDWLPATLTTLIVTAFSIVLVIGVIKLLWK